MTNKNAQKITKCLSIGKSTSTGHFVAQYFERSCRWYAKFGKFVQAISAQNRMLQHFLAHCMKRLLPSSWIVSIHTLAVHRVVWVGDVGNVLAELVHVLVLHQEVEREVVGGGDAFTDLHKTKNKISKQGRRKKEHGTMLHTWSGYLPHQTTTPSNDTRKNTLREFDVTNFWTSRKILGIQNSTNRTSTKCSNQFYLHHIIIHSNFQNCFS